MLGANAWCIAQHGAACRSFGFLVSKRRYVLTLEEGSAPPPPPPPSAPSTDRGEAVLRQHAANLLTPATPYFFNTLYDPYREGADFVRGYPFSLREGVATAVSHGLWLPRGGGGGACGSGAPRRVDAVLTVPRGAHFPLSAANLAFDRALLGPAMYLGPDAPPPPCGGDGGTAAGDGSGGGGSGYGGALDVWAGLCAKAVCDHLGLGAKTGLPYVELPPGAAEFAAAKPPPAAAALAGAAAPAPAAGAAAAEEAIPAAVARGGGGGSGPSPLPPRPDRRASSAAPATEAATPPPPLGRVARSNSTGSSSAGGGGRRAQQGMLLTQDSVSALERLPFGSGGDEPLGYVDLSDGEEMGRGGQQQQQPWSAVLGPAAAADADPSPAADDDASPAAAAARLLSRREVLDFFERLELSGGARSVAECYAEIAAAVRHTLGPLDPFFAWLADAMEAWVACWTELNPVLEL